MSTTEKYANFLFRLTGKRPEPPPKKLVKVNAHRQQAETAVEAAIKIRTLYKITSAVAYKGEVGGFDSPNDRTIYYYSDKLMIAWWDSFEKLLVIFPKPEKPVCLICLIEIKPPDPEYFTRTVEATYHQWMELAIALRSFYLGEYRAEIRARQGYCVTCDTDTAFYGWRIPR